MQLWDVATGKQRHLITKVDMCFSSVTYSFDGKIIALASASSTTTIWLIDAATGKEIQSMQGIPGSDLWTGSIVDTRKKRFSETAIALSPDSKAIALSSDDRKVRVWDVDAGKEIETLVLNRYSMSIAFSRDGRFLKTDWGWVRLASDVGPMSASSLFVKEEWITQGGQDILWIPLEQRDRRVPLSTMT